MIPLENAGITLDVPKIISKKKPLQNQNLNIFGITSPNRIYWLAGNDQEDCNEWVNFLTQYIVELELKMNSQS